MQAALWPVDPSGTALEIKSRCQRADPQRPEERLPVAEAFVFAGTGQRAGGGWASLWAGKLLARVQQGDCPTASQVGIVCLEAIPPQSLCAGDPPG